MKLRLWIALVLVVATFATGSDVRAQEADARTVAYTARVSRQASPITVTATLSIPRGRTGRLPAVVVLHGFGGIDGTGRPYVKALNQAGMVTLEVEMFKRYMPGEMHPTVEQNLPHVYGALRYLAERSEVDSSRIGVMGFSWGGAMAIVVSSAALTKEYGEGRLKYASHLALYPLCWLHGEILDGLAIESPHKFMRLDASTYGQFTGSPVHILAAGKDDFDAPDSCPSFLSRVSAVEGASVTYSSYPEARHGWDKPRNVKSHSPLARRGMGGPWEGIADPALAEKSRQFAVGFFERTLKP